MDGILDGSLPLPTLILVVAALLLAFSFEFVNGFHDTANAVATVIYTRSLRPTVAVIWSGFWNFLGVMSSTGAVAFGIVALLPVELILNVGSAGGFAMVFSLLLSAIIWNLGTWYLGLPASSSHTLIGSIVGVGLMNSYLQPGRAFGEGVNWGKVHDTAMALLVSPVVGFVCAALLIVVARHFLLAPKPDLFDEPDKAKSPPLYIRALLILTCTGVSFAHGSNDGQKGMGLVMLILIGLVPATYALNQGTTATTLADIAGEAKVAAASFHGMAGDAVAKDPAATLSAYLRTGKRDGVVLAALGDETQAIATMLDGVSSIGTLSADDRGGLRKHIYLVSEAIGKLAKAEDGLPVDGREQIQALKTNLKPLTAFIPAWVKVAIAIALGCGTMIGWKRIVVTVGEKIGKSHLTYAQGAAAELVAMSTIAAADVYGLPVSTTHVLSSGVAGTMAANRSGLQANTLRNVILAWVLTLPACVFLGAMLFGAGLYFTLNIIGMR